MPIGDERRLEPVRRSRGRPTPERILVVDDDEGVRELLEAVLERAGFEVSGAATGEAALERATEAPPDLVTLDIVMPRKSGLEALREIRGLDPGARIVMCSALGQEAMVMEALEAGAQDFIVKPFKPDQALGVIEKALSKED